jgi:hypothetical protein
MSYSFYDADQATHHRVIGSAVVAALVICLIGISYITKSEQQTAAAPTINAGMPVTTSDGGQRARPSRNAFQVITRFTSKPARCRAKA